MKILVTAASKHGSTAEIAGAIATELTALGHDVEVAEPDEVADLDGVDVVVLGSAVYAGRWLRAARDFVSRLRPELVTRRVWLFSSGPVGVPLKPAEDPIDVAGAIVATRAREHWVFAGDIDKQQLALGERAIVKALHAAVGDFRDWEAIADWARSIDTQLRQPASSA